MLAATSGEEEAIGALLPLGLGALAVDCEARDALMLALEDLATPPLSRYSNIFRTTPFPPIVGELIFRSNLLARDFLGESALDKARDLPLLPHLAEAIASAMGSSLEPWAPPKRLAETNASLQHLLSCAAQGDLPLLRKRLAQGADPRLPASPAQSTALMTAISFRLKWDMGA